MAYNLTKIDTKDIKLQQILTIETVEMPFIYYTVKERGNKKAKIETMKGDLTYVIESHPKLQNKELFESVKVSEHGLLMWPLVLFYDEPLEIDSELLYYEFSEYFK